MKKTSAILSWQVSLTWDLNYKRDNTSRGLLQDMTSNFILSRVAMKSIARSEHNPIQLWSFCPGFDSERSVVLVCDMNTGSFLLLHPFCVRNSFLVEVSECPSPLVQFLFSQGLKDHQKQNKFHSTFFILDSLLFLGISLRTTLSNSFTQQSWMVTYWFWSWQCFHSLELSLRQEICWETYSCALLQPNTSWMSVIYSTKEKDTNLDENLAVFTPSLENVSRKGCPLPAVDQSNNSLMPKSDWIVLETAWEYTIHLLGVGSSTMFG